MNRTRKLRIAWMAMIVVLLAMAAYVAAGDGDLVGVAVVSAFVILLLNRVLAWQWRELIAARRLQDAGGYREAIPLLERFLARLNRQAWLRWIIWMLPSFYTTNAEAMALNNLGACHLELGEYDHAESLFHEALTLDPLYSIPHYNLAVLELCRQHEDRSQQHLQEAARLGYTGGTIDKVIQRSKSIYARIEPAARYTG